MLEKLYEKAPYSLKLLMLNVKAFLNFKKRYNEIFEKYLNEYKNLWTAPISEVKSYQKIELIALLLDCHRFVPFYQNYFTDLRITEEEIKSDPYKVLAKLPLLSKADRRSKVDQLLNQNPQRPIVEVGYTSGTSGSPTKNYLDSESIAKGFSLWSRFHYTIGIGMKERSVRFSGRLIVSAQRTTPPFWLYNNVEKQLFMSSYHLSEKNIPTYLEKLNKFQPTFMDGYPSAFYILANHILEYKVSLKFTPKAIATTAETLYDYQRVIIQKAFGCSVYNQYASSEGSPFITECTHGNLHLNLDSGVFEFLNKKDNKAKSGEIGRMVVTSFRNSKTPLLRYDIEDTVLLSDTTKTCDCGCNMPLIEKIIGREDDVLWTEEKGYVGRMDTAYKGLEGILQSQIIQKSPSEILIKNIVDEKFTPAMEEKFIKNIKDRLGKDILVTLVAVPEIPLGPNGKFDAVKRLFKTEV